MHEQPNCQRNLKLWPLLIGVAATVLLICHDFRKPVKEGLSVDDAAVPGIIVEGIT